MPDIIDFDKKEIEEKSIRISGYLKRTKTGKFMVILFLDKKDMEVITE